MGEGVTLPQMLWVIFLYGAIISVIPVSCILIYIWFFRGMLKRKSEQLQERSCSDDFRCLGCGAVIDPDQQACQKCGWTWK